MSRMYEAVVEVWDELVTFVRDCHLPFLYTYAILLVASWFCG